MNTPARALRADILNLPAPPLGGAAVNAWNGVPNSSDTVLFANNDSTNTWYLGFRNNITVGGQNTIPLFSNSTVTLGANRTIYAIAIPGTTPLLVVPGGAYYYTKTTQAPTSGTPITEDPSAPPSISLDTTAGVFSITTAAFTPPNPSRLIAIAQMGNASAGANIQISDSGGHVWTKIVSIAANTNSCAIFTTTIASSASITVTATDSINTDQPTLHLTIKVLNGSASSQTGAGTGSASDSSGTTSHASCNITTTQNGSVVYGSILGGKTEIPDTGTSIIHEFDPPTIVSGMVSAKLSVATVTPGAISIGATWSTGNAQWVCCAAEILHA